MIIKFSKLDNFVENLYQKLIRRQKNQFNYERKFIVDKNTETSGPNDDTTVINFSNDNYLIETIYMAKNQIIK